MKRLHVHLRVSDLNASIAFYNTLFAQEPNVLKDDYAKWMLEDPRINFAISNRSAVVGIDHLGIQTDSLEQWREQNPSDKSTANELNEATTCCYAKCHKHWQTDPDGISWEHFTSIAESEHYGVDTHNLALANAVHTDSSVSTACCSPRPQSATACC